MSNFTLRSIALLAAIAVLTPSAAMARTPKKYQVTGKVIEVSDDLVVVLKDEEKWEIGRDKSTKIDGTLRIGEKVTVHYTMSAATVEVKADKPAAAPELKPTPAKPAPAK